MADFNEKLNQLNNTKDHTAEFDRSDIENNKVMGILSYIGILVLIPIFAAKNSKFARFHANQGLVLAIAEAIVWTVLGILGIVLSYVPVIRVIFAITRWLISLAILVPNVLGIVNAAMGRAKELPVIGFIRILR